MLPLSQEGIQSFDMVGFTLLAIGWAILGFSVVFAELDSHRCLPGRGQGRGRRRLVQATFLQVNFNGQFMDSVARSRTLFLTGMIIPFC